MESKIIIADYLNKKHAKDISFLLNSYAQDPMGGASPLDGFVIENLASELAKRSNAFSLLAYNHDQAIGLLNCF